MCARSTGRRERRGKGGAEEGKTRGTNFIPFFRHFESRRGKTLPSSFDLLFFELTALFLSPLLPTTTARRRASTTSTAALPSDILTLFSIEPPVGTSIDAAAASVASAAGDAADATGAAAGNSGGWLAPFARGFEAFLKLLDSGLEAAHVPYSYGFAIILLTFLVKAATYPLTRKQMASTISLQALQPRVKEIQERYKGKPQEEMQVEVARLYKEVRNFFFGWGREGKRDKRGKKERERRKKKKRKKVFSHALSQSLSLELRSLFPLPFLIRKKKKKNRPP